MADNGELDVLTSDNAWTIGSGGRVVKTDAGVSVLGASGSALTTVGSGQLAVEGGTLDVQAPLTMTGGQLQVAAGGVAELNNLTTLAPAHSLPSMAYYVGICQSHSTARRTSQATGES